MCSVGFSDVLSTMEMFMKRILVAVLFASALLVGAGASAATTQPDFNFVQAAAQSQDFTAASPVGFQLNASKAVGDVLFVEGSAQRTYLHSAVVDTQFRAGAGAKLALTSNTAAYGEAYLIHASGNPNQDLRSVTAYGYGFQAGIRSNVVGPLELRAGVATEKLNERANGFTTFGLVGAQINFTKSLALVGDARYHSQTDRQFDVGVRLSF